jgi:hypothetical protein
MITARELLKQAICSKKADGLVNVMEECGCGVDDLCPCDECNLDDCVMARHNKEDDMFYPLNPEFKRPTDESRS